jgi:syntaxin-binding protein 1
MPDEGNSSSIATSGVSSLRTGGSRYSANRRTNVGAPKTRMIVFVAGGACYSELRAAQEIMEKGGQEIILGSTHIMNPTEFVENLTSL